MVATEFVTPTGEPDAATVTRIIEGARRDHRVLLMNCGTNNNVVRWMPPLVVSEVEIDRAVAAFAAGLT
jgi:4-aminobutyrate aminotransferase-like enzyme